jgi:hypothetical protein
MNFRLIIITFIAVGVGLAFNGRAQLFLTNGLVAYYPLDGNANDQFGTGNAGILENGAFLHKWHRG